MCQSAKTSLVAWFVAATIAVLLISSGKGTSKWNGWFILTFILIQLIEFFIWTERKNEGLTSSAQEALEAGCDAPKNKGSSEALTRLIFIALWLQPLIQTYMAYKYGNQKYKKQLMVITIAYFVIFIWALWKAVDSKDEFESVPVVDCSCGKKACAMGHLQWQRHKKEGKSAGFLGPEWAGALYVFGLGFGLLFMKPKMFSYILLVTGGILIVYTKREHHKEEFASMWCIYAVLYAFVALVISYSRHHKNH